MIDSARVLAWGGDVPAEVGTATKPFGARLGRLVVIEADRLVGLGEASPLPGMSVESLEDCDAALATIRWGDLHVPSDVHDLRAILGRVLADMPSSVVFAVETALASISAERSGISVAEWLGRQPPAPLAPAEPRRLRSVPRSVYAGATNDPATAARAVAYVRRGIETLKLKRSPGPLDTLLATLRQIREEIGTEVALRLDYNGSLAPAEVSAEIEAVSRFGIELVEEPVSGAALLDVGELPIPWFCDESAVDADLRGRLLDHAPLGGFVLKPTLLGGLCACLDVARDAAAAGKDVLVTHAFEGPVALASCAALALALGPSARAPGLDAHAGLAAFGGGPIEGLEPGGVRVSAPRVGLGLASFEPPATLRGRLEWTR